MLHITLAREALQPLWQLHHRQVAGAECSGHFTQSTRDNSGRTWSFVSVDQDS
jgi:hypothetical protein